ncbi:alpha/beta-hydrolase [Thozetella sp. PMI_491]|nr:alpha/beta-hydrolase [Thozetella sp. PMI_491]
MATAQTAVTKFVRAATGVRFAYRWIGPAEGVPLVMDSFYRSNMDFWDPLLINNLASTRPVIIFDKAGVGRSSGEVATTYQGWADDQLAFLKALGVQKIDAMGFSMGGAAVQMVALSAPDLVRNLIITGTTASEPSSTSDVTGIVWPRDQAPLEPILILSALVHKPADIEHALAFSFFYDTEAGREEAAKYWLRLHERNVPGEPLLLEFLSAEGSARQRAAFADWSLPNPRNSYDRLGELKMPVLVMNGDNDVLVPTSRSWEMAAKIPAAQLVIYAKAGHGFLFQKAQRVAAQINQFLDNEGV